MNILPKKRWHVRTKDNVARVRRDEAQAAADEKARVERAALAEQEARTGVLRSKVAAKRSHFDGQDIQSSTEKNDSHSSSGHVNFFADLEEKERTFGANKERKEEIRLEKEAEEKKIGLLKYLGEGSSEYMKETPWYQKLPQRPNPAKERNIVKQTAVNNQEPSFTMSNVEHSFKSTSKREKKSKKRKKHSISSSSDSSTSSDHNFSKPNYDIEKLRQQRLEREKTEKLKSEQLLQKMRRGTSKNEEQPRNDKQINQKYSSQFNPDIARQNR
uniref:CBF1-interacting co-repressor CIR N-terminal domain-containing protein n=1 Tax=Romanomermis culicivorax TaxID=13658 RepID=A0A915J4M2_ROMCU